MKLPTLEPANTQHCVPHNATLSTASCAKRHLRAQHETSGQFAKCAGCEHGQHNAERQSA